MEKQVTIVPAREEHLEKAGEIAIFAWTGIHESYIANLGKEMHDHLFDGWEEAKVNGVKKGLMSGRGYIALVDGEVAGFIYYRVEEEKSMGVVGENAVSKDFKGLGIGAKMYAFILDKMREEGLKYATVHTGLDDGHAPARHSYEKAGFKKNLPSIKYYMEL